MNLKNIDCLNHHLIGDGHCNDETNNADCEYDDGDCCKNNVNSEHCTECICYHQESCAAGVNHEWVGNGYCNDETNNADCNYDGGDCCGNCVNVDHCSECECLGGVTGDGLHNALFGNGYCNEVTNNADCYYDGGDCLVCGPSNSDWGCCTSSKPCGIGEGDCDSDSGCNGDLICGSDNCQSLYSGWSSSTFDCCIEGK